MQRKLIVIAVLVAACFSGFAQTVTTKCGCASQTIEIQKWEWSRTDSTETLTDPDVNNWVQLDFKNKKALTPFGDTYDMKSYSSAFEPLTIISYSDVLLKIRYDGRGNYVSHTIEQR